MNQNFDHKSISIPFAGSSDFTFSDVSTGPFDPNQVGITTSGSGQVYTFFGDVYTTPNQTALPTTLPYQPIQAPYAFQSASQQTINDSLGDFTVVLSDVSMGQTYYGFAAFHGTNLLSYTFQTTPGLQVTLPVPLPASAPLFGAAILILGGLAYGRRRTTTAGAA